MWVRWAVEVRAEDEERLVGVLSMEGVEGLELIEIESGWVRTSAYLSPTTAQALSVDLSSFEGARLLPLEPVAPGPWAEGWPDVVAGPFVLRFGSSEAPVEEGQHVIHLEFGWGFGGGEHPTTRLCLEVLPDIIHPNDRVLDVGSGSGVLAIAAKQLAAGGVTALDIDPDARRATQSHAEINRVSVEVLHGGVQSLTEVYDVVLANLLAPILIDLAEVLEARTAPPGRLLLSGIVEDDVERVTAAFSRPVVRVWRQAGWAAVLM